MVESQGKEGPSEHARPLMPCKSGETEAQRAARPQDPRFLLPRVQYGGPRISPHFLDGLICPAKSSGGRGDQPSPTGEMLESGPLRSQLGIGASQGMGQGAGSWLPPLRPSVCLCAGSGLQRTLCRLSCSPPSLVPGPPHCPPVRMSDGCAPPQAPGPRPGSRSLAADTVCFPARDSHLRHRPFLPAPPTPMGLPGGPGCRVGPAFGSQNDSQTEPSPTLTCMP